MRKIALTGALTFVLFLITALSVLADGTGPGI